MKNIIFLLACLTVASAKAVVIDFDSLEVSNNHLNQIASNTYFEDGFTITGTPMYYAGQNHVNQYAGSAGLHLRSGGASISLVDSSSDVFSIDSIGLSILRNGASSPAVTFVGQILGGGTITQSFQPLSFGFTDFYFNSGFSNLTSLSWNQGSNESYAHQFDNISLNIMDVTEPGSLVLIGIGLAGLGLTRRKQAS